MNINNELNGLNRKIKRLRVKKNPPNLRMKLLNQWEVEEEQDINEEYFLMVRIKEKNPDLFSSRL